MQFFTKFLDKFELFIKRSMMPSIVFFILFFLVAVIAIFLKKDAKLEGIDTIIISFLDIKLTMSSFVLFFIFLIGLSHILSILTQIIFDNRIKNDYNNTTPCINIKENTNLILLRKKVIRKIKDKKKFHLSLNYTDFMLYQIVSRELKYYKKDTPTTRYVDDTKSSGITFVSLMISIFIWGIFFFEFFSTLGVCLLIWFIGYEHIKSKYRSRALRIYTNYLLGEEKENKKKDLSKNELKLTIPKDTTMSIQKD